MSLNIHNLEKKHDNVNEAVLERKQIILSSNMLSENKKNHFINATNLNKEYDYNQAHNSNCENMIGNVSIPVGIIQNVRVNSKTYHVPFATTEGTLIASISRGIKTLANGVKAIVINNGITRSLLIEDSCLENASNTIQKIKTMKEQIKITFESSSKYLKLEDIIFIQMGKQIHIRFQATTKDAMGMNMISIGVLNVWNNIIKQEFKDIKYISISGNTCTDKKFSAMNWIRGRGYEVNAEAIIDNELLQSILKTTPKQLVDIHIKKSFIGSSLAGTIGGNNSHAANIVAGLFLVTGQDIAQIGTSSMCLLNLECNENNDLYCSIKLPCLELGLIGGGTNLSPQKDYIGMMELDNTSEFASIIACCIIAGELSLLSALVNNELVSAHINLNRKK